VLLSGGLVDMLISPSGILSVRESPPHGGIL
jgi:hypothetical protein